MVLPSSLILTVPPSVVVSDRIPVISPSSPISKLLAAVIVRVSLSLSWSFSRTLISVAVSSKIVIFSSASATGLLLLISSWNVGSSAVEASIWVVKVAPVWLEIACSIDRVPAPTCCRLLAVSPWTTCWILAISVAFSTKFRLSLARIWSMRVFPSAIILATPAATLASISGLILIMIAWIWVASLTFRMPLGWLICPSISSKMRLVASLILPSEVLKNCASWTKVL